MCVRVVIFNLACFSESMIFCVQVVNFSNFRLIRSPSLILECFRDFMLFCGFERLFLNLVDFGLICGFEWLFSIFIDFGLI